MRCVCAPPAVTVCTAVCPWSAWRCCRCVRWGRGAAHAAVCGWCGGLLCCTVRWVGSCRVEGRSWAWRGVPCLCVRARQASAVVQQPDQWQFPQRGVRTVVADVSGCVLCLLTAGWHLVCYCVPMKGSCGAAAAVCDGVGAHTAVCGWCDVCCVVLYCSMYASVSGGGAVMGLAGCAVPVCARATGGWTWAATRSVAVSPAWCLGCRRLCEWLCAVCAHRRLSLG